MRNDELEARCRETGAVDDYAVYGDWLEQHGDPRGRLIALMLAGLPYEDYLAAHAALAPPPHVEVGWSMGFWRFVHVRDDRVDLAAVLADESARFVRTLAFHQPSAFGYRFAAFAPDEASEASPDESLEESIDPQTFAAVSSLVRADRDGQAWMTALPAIQRLQLGVSSLALVGAELAESDGRTIARIRGLRELHLSAAHGSPLSIPRATLRALAPLAGSLVELAVRECRSFDDESCPMVATFTQLEALEVPYSDVSAVGLAELARLPRLRKLDVCHCEYVDDECGDIIGTFPALETVAIKGTAMTAWGVKGIACSRTIGKLILDGDQYPEEIESILGIELASGDD